MRSGQGRTRALSEVRGVHGPVRVRGVLEVEDPPGVDRAVEHRRKQGLDVGAGRCRTAGEGDVVVEQASETDRRLFALRDADAADGAACANDADRLFVDRQVADRLQHDLRAVAAGGSRTRATPSSPGSATTSVAPNSVRDRRHEVCRPSRQNSQVFSDHANGAMTKSPRRPC